MNISDRLDAAASAFWTRAKVFIDQKLYEKHYPNLIGRDLVAAKTDIPPGASKVEYQMFDRVGAAKLIAAYADDLPRVDIFSTADEVPVRRLGVAFGHTYDEIVSAAMAGVQLSAMKGMAARKAIEEFLDGMIALGSTADGIYGLLNNPNVTVANVVNPGGGTAWSTKTAAQILTDMMEPLHTIIDTTFGRELPDTMVLPDTQYAIAASTRNSDSSDETVLSFFLKTNGHIHNVIPWYKCAGAGVSSVDRMVVYRRDPDVVEHALAEDFTSLAPQYQNLEAVVNCTAKHGGCIVRYPMAFAYRDGI